MKKTYKLNLIFAALFLGIVVLAFSAFNIQQESVQINDSEIKANKISEKVKNTFSYNNAAKINLFNLNNNYNKAEVNNFVKDSRLLKLNKNELNNIKNSKPSDLILPLSLADGSIINLNLIKTEIRSPGYSVNEITPAGKKPISSTNGIFYQGIIENNNRSVVTISIFENNVMGIISTDLGNFVLGAIKDDNKKLTDDYILYNDNDIIKKAGFECGSGDTYDRFYKDPVNNESHSNSDYTNSPVDIYFVADYQLYLDAGSSTTAVEAYVNGAFVHVKTLYQNDGLVVNLQGVDVYTSPDPYINLSTSTEILERFGDETQDNFQGDLAHLLSTGHGQQLGGIAWVNVLCQSYEPGSHSGRFAFSNIEGTYTPYPTYSWTVMVITHETGHNYGSMHTHSCVWPTISGQIDSCYTSEGGCVTGTRPNNNGTIMSYCHLNGAINMLNGFGPLPKDTITFRYNQALCLDNPLNSSETPVAYNLLQNYPNPFNPATNIKFALPEAGFVTLKVYDVSGREVAELIGNRYYNIGIFSYSFDAAAFSLASGVYFYKLDVTKDNNSVYSQIKKMVLVK